MLGYFTLGMQVGLVLCFMIGPIFFTLIQTSVEEGAKAGLFVGLGIWLSDITYILSIYWGISYIVAATEFAYFRVYMGVIGGIILIAFGLGSLLSRRNVEVMALHSGRTSAPFSLFSKGFLVNAINPFTVFFWLGITTKFAVQDALEPIQALWLFSGIVLTVVSTDFVKVFLAKSIRNQLKPVHLLWVRKGVGIILIAFGVGMIIDVAIKQAG